MYSCIPPLSGGLVVSCQAREDNPLHGPHFMTAMAQAAQRAGAVGIRANGPMDIEAIKSKVPLPLIGIYKKRGPDGVIIITPDFESARDVANAGSDIIAISCVEYQQPDDAALGELIKRIHDELHLPVMADVGTKYEGVRAAKLGVDIVASTMSGYTKNTVLTPGPDVDLVRELSISQECPVIAEGRYSRPEHLKLAIQAGAYAIVVGTAITNPMAITSTFVAALPR